MQLPKFNEKDLLIQFATQLQHTGSFIDIGAHIGSFSLAFAEIGWRVTAVEAAPDIYEELNQRATEFSNVLPIHAAATEAGGDDVDFFISSEYWGIHSLRPFDESHNTFVRVPAMTLAEIIRKGKSYDPLVIKVDAEGADLMVLRGGDWQETRPILVMCEFMDSRTVEYFGYGYRDTVAYMENLGYVTYISEWAEIEEHSRRGVRGAPFIHIQVLPSPLAHEPSWGNLIFVVPQLKAQFESTLTAYLADLTRQADEDLSQASEMRNEVARSRDTIGNRERKIRSLEDLVASKEQRIADLTDAIEQRDKRNQELNDAIQQRDKRNQELNDAIQQRDKRNQELNDSLTTATQLIARFKKLTIVVGLAAFLLLNLLAIVTLRDALS